MTAKEYEKLIDTISGKHISEEDQERFHISDMSAIAYNMALDNVIKTIQEDFSIEDARGAE